MDVEAKRRELRETLWTIVKTHQFGGIADIDLEDDELICLRTQVNQIIHAIAPLVEIVDKEAELPELSDEEIYEYALPPEVRCFAFKPGWLTDEILERVKDITNGQRDKLAGFHRTYSVEG